MRSSEHGWHTKDLAATGLHRLRIGNFLDLTKQSGLELVHLQLLPVWRQVWGTKWPGLRELGTMKLGAVLRRESFAA